MDFTADIAEAAEWKKQEPRKLCALRVLCGDSK